MTLPHDLLRQILERPWDDGPRLVLADALDERGQDGDREFAEFVRAQINDDDEFWLGGASDDLRDFAGIRWDWNNWRATELWGGELESILPKDPRENCTVRWPRGFVDSVSLPLSRLVGGESCPYCENGGVDTGAFTPWDSPIRVTCLDCHGTGRTNGIAAELAKWPITSVAVSDAVIHPSGGNDTYYLGGLGAFPKEYWHRLENHRSRMDVRTALSQVCVDLIRDSAEPKLPKLEWKR